MPRTARLVAVNYPHHITQRSNYQQTIFENRQDYFTYLKLFEEYRKKHELDVLAYCLMPNHIHFITIPRNDYSLAKTYSCCNMRYSQHFNKKKDIKGLLWHSRFYSCILDERHLYAAIKYVENNPVASKLTARPQDWEFSSASQHLYDVKGYITLFDVNQLLNIKNWQEYLRKKNDGRLISSIESNTFTGRPAGNFGFIKKLEHKFNIRLRPMPKGRPFKKK